MLRSAGGSSSVRHAGMEPLLPQLLEEPSPSRRISPASTPAAATPRESTPPASALDSDSDSENSSRMSVASSSLASRMPSNPETTACPAPFGVHLEWRLKAQTRLPRSTQLSLQRGSCPGCKEKLTTSLFKAPRYCHYLGCYFCPACHEGELRVIPARVAERWDFEARKVCRMAAQYLDMQASQPLVPITRVKRTKVSSQGVLTEMHTLRQTLTRIFQVLLGNSCEYHDTFHAISAMQLPPHMMTGHELYTMQDLIHLHLEARSCGALARLLRLVTMGTEHIQVCPQCRVSARFCSLCTSVRPIFPFEVGKYHTCETCQETFHHACFQRAGSECPVCCCCSVREHGKGSVAGIRPR